MLSQSWIPAEYKLPNDGQDVLVAYDHPRCGESVDCAVFQHVINNGDYIPTWTVHDFLIHKVTHWMPMPKHPTVLLNEESGKLEEWINLGDDLYEEELSPGMSARGQV